MKKEQKNHLVFIHGAFCGTTYGKFRQPLDRNGGFQVLDKYFESGEIKLYYWAKDRRKFSWLNFFNPFCYLQTYLIDKSHTNDELSLAGLNKLIQDTKPTKILAHSLGSRKLVNYLKNYNLPDSVREIYILAGELPQKNFQLKKNIKNRIKSDKLQIYNYYCPWDQALIFSSLYHFNPSLGVWRINNPYIKNIFYPLDLKGNPHNTHFRDKKLASKIMS